MNGLVHQDAKGIDKGDIMAPDIKKKYYTYIAQFT